MSRFLYLPLLALALSTGAAAQSTKKPVQPKPRPAMAAPAAVDPAPAAVTSDGQGEYVAPGMTGAPRQRVTTDYDNQPLKKPATGTSTLSAEPAAKPKP